MKVVLFMERYQSNVSWVDWSCHFCVCGGKSSETPTKLCLSRNSVISIKNLVQLDILVSAVQICKLTDFERRGRLTTLTQITLRLLQDKSNEYIKIYMKLVLTFHLLSSWWDPGESDVTAVPHQSTPAGLHPELALELA